MLATGETFEQVYVRRGFEEINVDNNATQSNRSQSNRTQSNGAMTKPVVCEQQNCRTIVPSQSNNANGVLAHGNISGDDRVNSNSIGSVDKVEDGNSDTDRR